MCAYVFVCMFRESWFLPFSIAQSVINKCYILSWKSNSYQTFTFQVAFLSQKLWCFPDLSVCISVFVFVSPGMFSVLALLQFTFSFRLNVYKYQFQKFNDTTLRLSMYKRFVKTFSFTKPGHALVRVCLWVCVRPYGCINMYKTMFNH